MSWFAVAGKCLMQRTDTVTGNDGLAYETVSNLLRIDTSDSAGSFSRSTGRYVTKFTFGGL